MLRAAQDTHAEFFGWDVPPGSEQVLAGVGFGAEPPDDSFGGLRSSVIGAALERHRGGTFEDFYREVRNVLLRSGVEQDRVHLNIVYR